VIQSRKDEENETEGDEDLNFGGDFDHPYTHEVEIDQQRHSTQVLAVVASTADRIIPGLSCGRARKMPGNNFKPGRDQVRQVPVKRMAQWSASHASNPKSKVKTLTPSNINTTTCHSAELLGHHSPLTPVTNVERLSCRACASAVALNGGAGAYHKPCI
jgi:hypothetical protein